MTNTEVAKYEPRVAGFAAKVRVLTIKKPKDLELANTLLKEVHEEEKLVLAHKEELTRPLMTGLSKIREAFKNPEQSLKGLKDEIKKMIGAYNAEEEEKRRIKEARILARAEKGTMRQDTAIEKIEQMSKEAPSNVRTRQVLEIYDESKLPREYLVADRVAITKTLFAGGTVEGARLIEQRSVVTPRS